MAMIAKPMRGEKKLSKIIFHEDVKPLALMHTKKQINKLPQMTIVKVFFMSIERYIDSTDKAPKVNVSKLL